MNAPGLYWCDTLPAHWIVVDRAGQAWIVGTQPGAWAKRTPYNGHQDALQPALPATVRLSCKIAGIPPAEVGL